MLSLDQRSPHSTPSDQAHSTIKTIGFSGSPNQELGVLFSQIRGDNVQTDSQGQNTVFSCAFGLDLIWLQRWSFTGTAFCHILQWKPPRKNSRRVGEAAELGFDRFGVASLLMSFTLLIPHPLMLHDKLHKYADAKACGSVSVLRLKMAPSNVLLYILFLLTEIEL